jgi:hypothetical protein
VSSEDKKSPDAPAELVGPVGQPGRMPPGWKKDQAPGFKPAICHPDREYYSKGFCKSCYNNQNKQAKKAGVMGAAQPKVIAPESTVSAALDAKVQPIQVMTPFPEPAFPIPYQKPQVAAHVARSAVMHNMDMEAAVKEMAPELSAGEAADVAEKLEGAVQVKVAIEKELAKRGLDEQSKVAFVDKMWRWLEGQEGEKRALTAARILGKGFISERIDVNKPMDLPIRDLSSGIAVMMSGVGSSKVVAADTDEEEENDEQERRLLN